VEHGTFPFYRSDDIHEERRLLYVACTRAQTSLYLTHTSKRKVAGVFKSRDLSEFISKIRSKCPPLFSDMPHTHSPQDLRLIARILDRGSRIPDELEVKRRMTMFNLTARQIHLSHTNVDGNSDNQPVPPPPIMRDIPANYVPTFQSVRAGLRGDEISTAVEFPYPARHVERPKLTPVNPTGGFVDQSVRLCRQDKVESPAQSAVYPRSDRSQLLAMVSTEATEAARAETKRSDRTITGPQFRALKSTPADLTCVKHLVPFAPPAKLESPAQPAVHSQSDRLQSCRPVSLEAEPIAAGIKRKRLGMGRGGAGYTNKKFKVPAPP
jgi:DNA helicase-2/ATP-dependent DNA helicase PcrA